MSVGHLMANTLEDIHVTASVMAEIERLNIIQRRSNPVGVTGSCGTKMTQPRSQ